MSDVSVRMTLQDDVSAKMQRITASARTAATQFSNAGRAMDSAFRSSAATSFASQAGSAFNSVESDAEALGNAIDDAVSGLESFSAGDTRGMGSAFSEAADNADDLSDSASRASESVDDLADATGDLGDGADGTLTNSQVYPHNNSIKTLQIVTPRNTKDYTITVEVVSVTGGAAGEFEISDKLLNGFKIKYTGSASSVVVRCYVRGGI